MSSEPTRPKQPRAIKTREKLMQALERLLRQHEFENISVQDIAKEAGVAVGSVYSHFKDKNAFLEALLEYWREQVESQLMALEAEDRTESFRAIGSLYEALEIAVRSVHSQIRESGHILRAVHTYTRLHPDIGDENWQNLVIRSFASIGVMLEVFEDEITVSDVDLTKRMLGFIFNTIFIRAALMPQDSLLSAIELDDEILIREVTDMIYAYLTMPTVQSSA